MRKTVFLYTGLTMTPRLFQHLAAKIALGFETRRPGSFSDGDAMRRRYAKKLLDVAVKQLPDRGVFKHLSASPAQPPK